MTCVHLENTSGDMRMPSDLQLINMVPGNSMQLLNTNATKFHAPVAVLSGARASLSLLDYQNKRAGTLLTVHLCFQLLLYKILYKFSEADKYIYQNHSVRHFSQMHLVHYSAPFYRSM